MIKEHDLKVILKGREPEPPEKVLIEKGADLAKVLRKALDSATFETPILLSTQPGTGKTHGVLHGILPWAMEHDMKLLYVSSRTAINTQTKEQLIDITGQEQLKEELTREGIRRKTDFGPVTVVTYHKLYQLMVMDPQSLSGYGIFVFDEVHALVEDAMYVGFTEHVLQGIDEYFKGKLRVYMTATPDRILPRLMEMEASLRMKVIHMPRDYNYVIPHFFSKNSDIITQINADTSPAKWLVFMPSIKQGEKFAAELKCSYCMLNADERAANPEKWYKVLDQERFEEKICIVTAVVDAGVNFHDDQLKNVVIYSISPVTFTQVLGRKRKKPGETLHMYVHCPAPSDMEARLKRNLDTQSACRSFYDHKARFLQENILAPTDMDLRSLMYVYPDGGLEPNKLALAYLEDEEALLENYLKYSKEHKDPYCFDRFVARWLFLHLPPRSECWLDEQFTGTGRREFIRFLESCCGHEMSDTAFTRFASDFQKRCIAAFGKASGGKDRDDRSWGLQKINNKLTEHQLPYRVELDNVNKVYSLVQQAQ